MTFAVTWRRPYLLALLLLLPGSGLGRIPTKGTQTYVAPGGAGIARDTGSTTFPVDTHAGGFSSSGTSFASSSFSSTATSGLVVVVANLANQNATNFGVPTLAGQGTCSGLAFTKRVEGDTASGHHHLSQVWTAPFSSALSACTVLLSWTTADTASYVVGLLVDALTGTNGIGVSNVNNITSTAAATVGLTGVTAGSWIYVGSGEEGGNTAFTPNGSTTEYQDFYSGAAVATLAGTSTATGNPTVGWTTTIDYGPVAAVEILAL